MTPPSISLIGVAAFKWLINAGEEVYTINIQLTSNYMDIEALQAISNQPAPTSTLHSEPLPTDEVELFAKVIPEAYQDFWLRTCLLIASLTTKFTLRMTRHLPIATSLAQSSVSFVNSLMICSASVSSNHLNRQAVHLSSLLRRRMAPCDSALTSKT